MTRRALLTFIMVGGAVCLLGACASTPPASSPPRLNVEQAHAWDRQGAPRSSPQALRSSPRATSGASSGATRPRLRARSRGPRVDVRFDRASLPNALRFLADAAHLDLVIEAGVSGQVTMSLRRVRALDALIALAEAHGASATVRHNVVIVRGR